MRRLVALDLKGSPAFVDAAMQCFDAGDAISPIDQRLSTKARQRVLAALRPTAIIDSTGEMTNLDHGEPVEEGDLVVVATSGTTGLPKGVILTRDAVTASARATSARLAVDSASDHWVCSLPLSHVGGLSVVLRSIMTNTPLTLFDRFDCDLYDDALEHRATLTSLVPTTLSRLGTRRVSQFRSILLGGSALPVELPDNVVRTYGMTETGSGVVYDGLALDGVEMKFSAVNEILLRCPMLLRAYRDGSDPKDKDGFYATGDVGTINTDGRLEVFGRTSELIISGGENIWPIALEQLLSDAPGVEEIAVVGVADPEWGQRVVGVVVSTPGQVPEIADINGRIKDQIGPWAVLKELISVGALPRTSIGKLDRANLATMVAKNPQKSID